MSIFEQDAREVMKRVGGAWSWLFGFGAIGVAAGICMFFFTGQALHVIAIAFGVWLVIAGVFRFVGAFAVPHETEWVRALYALLAMVAVAAGVFLIAHPILSLLALTLTIGFVWIFMGMMELFVGVDLAGLPHRGWLIFSGAMSVIAGWVIVFFPGISILSLALLLGIWLVVYGASAMGAALRLRRLTQPVRGALRPQHTAG